MATESIIQLGQRVWVTDQSNPGGRTFGYVAALSTVYLNGSASFVVKVDGGKPTVITCCEDRRGSQWDFAEEG
jgi:hypothetical protein